LNIKSASLKQNGGLPSSRQKGGSMEIGKLAENSGSIVLTMFLMIINKIASKVIWDRIHEIRWSMRLLKQEGLVLTTLPGLT